MRKLVVALLVVGSVGCAVPHADEPVWFGVAYHDGCSRIAAASVDLDACMTLGTPITDDTGADAYQCALNCTVQGGNASCPSAVTCDDAINVIGTPD